MAKRSVEQESLLNSSYIEEQNKLKLAHLLNRIWKFSFAQEGNNRSTSKTDLLHHGLKMIILNSLHDYRINFEERFDFVHEASNGEATKRIFVRDIFDNKFNVDLLIKDKQDKNKYIILIKMPLTSINKNKYNSALNQFGEIMRIFGCEENKEAKLIFLNVEPDLTFVKSKDKLTIERVDHIYLTKDLKQKLCIQDEIREKVMEIKITYSMFSDLYMMWENCSDINENLNIENLIDPSTINFNGLKDLIRDIIEESTKEIKAELNKQLDLI